MQKLWLTAFIWMVPGLTLAWELVQVEVPVGPDSVFTETVWQRQVTPGTKFDRVAFHRYRNPERTPVATLLYLPGTNMNGALAVTSENHNLWLYLANRGIIVFAMDYRTHFVSHNETTLDFMKSWTVNAFVDDATLVADQIGKMQPELPLFVAGFSRGVSYAYALAGRVELAGLIALDGSFKQPDSRGFDLASALQRFDKLADYASVLSRRGFDARMALLQGAFDDPSGPSIDERYETIGEQLAVTLHNAWGSGALANTQERLTPIRILAQQMRDYDWYFPSIQNIQGRSLSSHADDPGTNLDDHFGNMTLPILYFGSTGMGTENALRGVYSATRSGSKDVTLNLLEGYGHVDVLVASRARYEVFDVIEQWLKRLSEQ